MRQVVNTEHRIGGAYNILRYVAASPTVFEGTMAGVDQQGKHTGGRVRFEFNGPGEFVLTATNVFMGDKVEPDQKIIFRRR